MKLDKSNIEESQKFSAQRALNQIRGGSRVFGNPAEGLKKTLKKLEEEIQSSERNPLDFGLSDKDSKAQISKIKAGIDGEEGLAEYLSKLVRLDEDLQNIIVFASLSIEDSESKSDELGYIPDTDFLILYGNDLMILDVKNLRTDPNNPLYISEGSLNSMNGVLIENIVPSRYVWEKFFNDRGVEISSITEHIVIYNKFGASILRNNEWYKHSRPIHISELRECLKEWIKDKEKVLKLRTVVELLDSQIRKEKSGIDLSEAFRKFKL